MFRENKTHTQTDLFNSKSSMDSRLKERLKKRWAGLFYQHVFSQVDEKLFAPLYFSDNGRPNFPVNIFAGLDIIKHLKGYVDEVLSDKYAYNYQISYALGLRSIGELYFGPEPSVIFGLDSITTRWITPRKAIRSFNSLKNSYSTLLK